MKKRVSPPAFGECFHPLLSPSGDALAIRDPSLEAFKMLTQVFLVFLQTMEEVSEGRSLPKPLIVYKAFSLWQNFDSFEDNRV